MGLRDQLLKAGLVNRKQAKKVESEARRQEHAAKKNKDVAKALEAQKEEEQQALEALKEQKKEADRLLNLEREAIRIEKEKGLRCNQLIKSNQLNDPRATETYFFVEDMHVRKVFVTAYQREMLARGRYAITRLEEDTDVFAIIPSYTAQTVNVLRPNRVLTLHPPVDDREELNDGTSQG